MKLIVDYPTLAREKEILQTASSDTQQLEQMLSADNLLMLQDKVQQIDVSEQMIDYIAQIVSATREKNYMIAYGASPRWSLAILSLAKALTFIEWRNEVEKKDVQRVILPALRHRIILSVTSQMEERKDQDILYGAIEKLF